MIMESVNVVFDDVTSVQWENNEEQKKDTSSDVTKDPSTASANDISSPSEPTKEMSTLNVQINHSSSDVIGKVN